MSSENETVFERYKDVPLDAAKKFQLQTSGDCIRVVHPLFQVEGGGSIPTSPLQLHVGEITLDKAIELNALWHSRLPVANATNMQRVRHLACFGAEYDGIFYACAIWTDPIARAYNGRHWLELRRMAISDDAPANTGSRLLRIMRLMIRRKWPHIARLISYQDTEVHDGTIYKAAGWSRMGENKAWSWTGRTGRPRNTEQAKSTKNRWEILL